MLQQKAEGVLSGFTHRYAYLFTIFDLQYMTSVVVEFFNASHEVNSTFLRIVH